MDAIRVHAPLTQADHPLLRVAPGPSELDGFATCDTVSCGANGICVGSGLCLSCESCFAVFRTAPCPTTCGRGSIAPPPLLLLLLVLSPPPPPPLVLSVHCLCRSPRSNPLLPSYRLHSPTPFAPSLITPTLYVPPPIRSLSASWSRGHTKRPLCVHGRTVVSGALRCDDPPGRDARSPPDLPVGMHQLQLLRYAVRDGRLVQSTSAQPPDHSRARLCRSHSSSPCAAILPQTFPTSASRTEWSVAPLMPRRSACSTPSARRTAASTVPGASTAAASRARPSAPKARLRPCGVARMVCMGRVHPGHIMVCPASVMLCPPRMRALTTTVFDALLHDPARFPGRADRCVAHGGYLFSDAVCVCVHEHVCVGPDCKLMRFGTSFLAVFPPSCPTCQCIGTCRMPLGLEPPSCRCVCA